VIDTGGARRRADRHDRHRIVRRDLDVHGGGAWRNAKLLEDGGRYEARLTQTAGRALTPQYASSARAQDTDALEALRKIARNERRRADAGLAALLLARAPAERGQSALTAEDAALAADALETASVRIMPTPSPPSACSPG